MLEEINMLREKLDNLVLEDAPYEELLFTSKEIDKLLIEYYNSLDSYKEVV